MSIANPGSAEAGREGCSCSPQFNNKGVKAPEGGWKIRPTCPVHAPVVPAEAVADEVAVVPAKVLKPGLWTRFRTWLGTLTTTFSDITPGRRIITHKNVMDAGPLFTRSDSGIPTDDETGWQDEIDG